MPSGIVPMGVTCLQVVSSSARRWRIHIMSSEQSVKSQIKYSKKATVYISFLEKPYEFIQQHEGTLETILTEVQILLLVALPFGLNPLVVLRAQTPNIHWKYHKDVFKNKKCLDDLLQQSDYIWACADGFVSAMKYGSDYKPGRKVYLSSGFPLHKTVEERRELVSTFLPRSVQGMIKNRDNLLIYSRSGVACKNNLNLLGL